MKKLVIDSMSELLYTKYRTRGALQWNEMLSRDIRKFNAFQQGRYELIARYLGDIKDKRILDLGGGDAALAYVLYTKGARLTVLDNEPEGIRLGKENFASKKAPAEFIVGSAYKIPFSDGEFDHVVCSEVVEHLEMPEIAMAEAARVLKPGGTFVLTTPYRLLEEPTDSDDLRAYFPSEVEALLKPYFAHIHIRLTHHIFWFGLYTYTFRRFRNRPLGKWFINGLALWFHFNPFTLEYRHPAKFDRFAQIIALSQK
jgi:ubiquinone/menaquinone biosynthesis C-methylase UbiE